MNHNFVSTAVFFFLYFLGMNLSYAAGEIWFPEKWMSWTSVDTPLTKIGGLPGCNTDVSSLPPIYQETVETYCNVTPRGPGAVKVLIEPSSMKDYAKKNGNFADGPSMVLQLVDLEVLFVTGIVNDKPAYSVFKYDGTDITASEPSSPFSAQTCRTCHTGYRAFCTQGQCGSKIASE